jgi:hypothetical protein
MASVVVQPFVYQADRQGEAFCGADGVAAARDMPQV